MTNRSAAAVVLLALFAATHAGAQAKPHSMYVSVVDQAGAPAADLKAADFVIREDNVAREILSVGPANDPMHVAVLVDNSQGAERFIRDYREGLTAFVTDMTADPAAKHQVAIITVGERPTINTNYTSDQAQLIKGAQRIFHTSGSGSYMRDGIIETSDGLLKRGDARPVILALVGPGPEFSDRTYDHVLERLHLAGAALNVVTLGPPISEPQDFAIALDKGVKTTGGRYDIVLASTGLPVRLKQVAAELTHQYRVTYARPDTLIPPETITVSTTRPGLTARGIPVKLEDRR